MLTSALCYLVIAGDPRLQRAAQTNVAAFRKAILARDVAWFERTYGPTFYQKVGGRAIDREAALGQLRKGLLNGRVRTLQAKVVGVKPVGKGFEASVAFTGTMRATIQGRPATLVAKWRDEQTWGLDRGRWGLRSLNTHDFTQTIETK